MAIAPLVFVICVSLVREGIEDYYRHKLDNKLNALTSTIMIDGEKEEEIKWSEI